MIQVGDTTKSWNSELKFNCESLKVLKAAALVPIPMRQSIQGQEIHAAGQGQQLPTQLPQKDQGAIREDLVNQVALVVDPLGLAVDLARGILIK